jgi:beta-aspartyl-peptidase (threonine type)
MIRKFFLIPFIIFALSCSTSEKQKEKVDYALVIHGGAGYMTLESLSEESQEEYLEMLEKLTETGLEVLKNGGDATDAVETVIRTMEDSPLFNAGRGAVFTHDGSNELDASIMNGNDLNAGAVAGVKTIKHPISAARKVMEVSEHVLLAGEGAEKFANEEGLEIVDASYFFTRKRFEDLIRTLENEGVDVDSLKKEKLGTVGCVALDRSGNICAGTSTGGRTNKKYGRIGDSPLIGSGTYAKNSTCGVSATGHGEFFIRYAVCHEISSLMEYRNMSVERAAYEVIHNQLKPVGGDGGVICLDAEGNYAMEFNTTGMFRAYGNSKGERITEIF